jgi:hypothetical protein
MPLDIDSTFRISIGAEKLQYVPLEEDMVGDRCKYWELNKYWEFDQYWKEVNMCGRQYIQGGRRFLYL